MKTTLVYLLAGLLQSEPMPDMPHCIIQMENLPMQQRALSSCRTQGIIVHWKDVRPMIEQPTNDMHLIEKATPENAREI